VAQDAWRVMIRDHHEGYIDWDGFVANRLRLAANRTNGEGLSGPAREGLCLLQGMLLCGVCGRRLGVRYTGNGGIYPVYQCIWKHREALAPGACLTVPATPLDQSVTERLVGAITPVTIELALAALTSLEDRDREIGAQWRMRIERARYEVDLAERRYEAVDPGNRLIAATLEQRWNDAMQRLQDLEAELTAFERQTMRAVTAEQKRQILQLAGDFPKLWAASTTTPRDRKRILRLFVRDITVTKGPELKASDCTSAGRAGLRRHWNSKCLRTAPRQCVTPRLSWRASESWRSITMTTPSSACCTQKVARVQLASRLRRA
jgi:hypothetical protein